MFYPTQDQNFVNKLMQEYSISIKDISSKLIAPYDFRLEEVIFSINPVVICIFECLRIKLLKELDNEDITLLVNQQIYKYQEINCSASKYYMNELFLDLECQIESILVEKVENKSEAKFILSDIKNLFNKYDV